MPNTRSPCPPGFRGQIVELVRAVRTPEEAEVPGRSRGEATSGSLFGASPPHRCHRLELGYEAGRDTGTEMGVRGPSTPEHRRCKLKEQRVPEYPDQLCLDRRIAQA